MTFTCLTPESTCVPTLFPGSSRREMSSRFFSDCQTVVEREAFPGCGGIMISFLGSVKQSYLGGDLGRDPGEELCSLPQLSLAGTPLLCSKSQCGNGNTETQHAAETGMVLKLSGGYPHFACFFLSLSRSWPKPGTQ